MEQWELGRGSWKRSPPLLWVCACMFEAGPHYRVQAGLERLSMQPRPALNVQSPASAPQVLGSGVVLLSRAPLSHLSLVTSLPFFPSLISLFSSSLCSGSLPSSDLFLCPLLARSS